jgi:predicted ester cyclase
MSLDRNKELVRRHFEDFWTKGDLDVADEIYASDTVGHYASNPVQRGYPECEKDLVRMDLAAFPDGVAIIQDQIAEGDKVLTRWLFEGTNTGPLFGRPPTGRSVAVAGLHLHRIATGRIVEVWAHPDTMSFMGQLGLLSPADGEG